MRKYCKAYLLRDLRRFSAWTAKDEMSEEKLSDNDVVYLWDDLTVSKSPFIADKDLMFDAATPEWQNFCLTALQFQIPEDLLYAYDQQEKEVYKTIIEKKL
jgi:hypothetical protein